jgi:hypothetical protein
MGKPFSVPLPQAPPTFLYVTAIAAYASSWVTPHTITFLRTGTVLPVSSLFPPAEDDEEAEERTEKQQTDKPRAGEVSALCKTCTSVSVNDYCAHNQSLCMRVLCVCVCVCVCVWEC